jgi:hypothetical protein
MSSYGSRKAEDGRGDLHFTDIKADSMQLKVVLLKRGTEDAGRDGK